MNVFMMGVSSLGLNGEVDCLVEWLCYKLVGFPQTQKSTLLGICRENLLLILGDFLEQFQVFTTSATSCSCCFVDRWIWAIGLVAASRIPTIEGT